MTNSDHRTPVLGLLDEVKRAALDTSYVSMGTRRLNSVHEYYRYPARFSPRFARAVMSAFSSAGDVVLDPFVGGGTVLVEGETAVADCSRGGHQPAGRVRV